MDQEPKNNNVVVRFPPSPTGLFHVGNARTFLFNYIFAKQNNGKILFRLEDTDKERSKEEYADDIIENLKWLGIEPDFSSMVRQSERTDIYKKYLQKMIDTGNAYISKEEVVEEGQRAEVIRFKNPNKKIKFIDLIRGEIEFDTTELKDFVIAKSLEEPVYHLAVVVDDFEMGVTHVIRGDDGISNTPRQILIQDAIGAPRPIYAHLPMMLATDKSKLSKRKHGEQVSVSFYREAGYLPEAMINFLALIGWNPGTDQEIFSMEELIEKFDIAKVQKAGAVFNVEKLDWVSKQYIKNKSVDELQNIIKSFVPEKWKDAVEKNSTMWKKIIETEKERISKFSEIQEGIGLFFETPEYTKELLKWKTGTPEEAKKHLTKILETISSIDEKDFSLQNIKNLIWPYAEENGKGNVLWPLRAALTGLERSPEPFTVSDILGKSETIKRIEKALDML